MGFLDKRDRVIDFVLTERGRELYAMGQLEFEYFSLSDDGLDYDPYSTGSLSDADRDIQIRAIPSWEAPLVRDVRDSSAPLEPTNHLFRASAGYERVPYVSSPATGSALDLMCDQAREGGSYRRSGTSIAQIDLGVSGEAEAVNPGFQIRVFSSGSAGLTEVYSRRDMAGRRAFDPFIAAVIDGEVTPDVAKVDDPSSARAARQAFGPDVSRIGRSK